MVVVWHHVFSSNVERMGYDEFSKDMFVEWKTGKTSVYADVPEEVFTDVSNSYSVGNALREQVIGKYKHSYE